MLSQLDEEHDPSNIFIDICGADNTFMPLQRRVTTPVATIDHDVSDSAYMLQRSVDHEYSIGIYCSSSLQHMMVMAVPS
jgi:hypothetical protein